MLFVDRWFSINIDALICKSKKQRDMNILFFSVSLQEGEDTQQQIEWMSQTKE